MATSSPSIDAAAAVADMESELQQLRQLNKELLSQVELLTRSQQKQPNKKGRDKKSSIGNSTDDNDNYQLYSTPKHTPTPSDDYGASDSQLEGVVVPNLHEVEMGNLKTTPTLSQKRKIINDGGGDYARALTSPGDEEEPPISTINNTEEARSDDPFIDDDSHNKHRSRKRNNNMHGGILSSSSPSVIATTSPTFPPFSEAIRERAGWLIGLLFFQSCSSFIIAYNEKFLQAHMVIVQFLTMLVGAGGNAGNQSAVGVIRGLAIGTINGNTWRDYLRQEAKMAAGLSCLIGLTGFIRAALFRTPWGETIAITTSVFIIVMTSVAFGSTLPLAMKKVGIDPAHSSTTIQVIMDILGVLITVLVSSFVMSFAVFEGDGSSVVDDDATYKMNTADVGRYS